MKNLVRFGSTVIAIILATGAQANDTKIKWTDKPDLAVAPADKLIASLDGHDVTLTKVTLSLTGKWWTIILGDLDSGGDPGLSVGSLAVAPAKGKKLTLAMGESTDTWAMVPGKKDATIMDNWNGPVAAIALELTDYASKPCNKKDEGKAVGKASGRVVAMLKGFQTTKDSWVAGTFKDAVVQCKAAK